MLALCSPVARLQARISAWPGVQVLLSRDRGERFCVCGGEFLHFHGDRQVDIRLPADVQERALNEGRARFHPRAHEGGWVIVPLDQPGAVHALRLAAAAYRFRVATRRQKVISCPEANDSRQG